MRSANDGFSSGQSSMPIDGEPTEEDGLYGAQRPSIMAICTDSSRCGSAIYSETLIHLVADRRDSSDPYKGLDIMIQRVAPEVVIVSSVQTKIINFLEKRFRFNLLDLSKRKFPRSTNYEQVPESSTNSASTNAQRCIANTNFSQISNLTSMGGTQTRLQESQARVDDPSEIMELNMQVFQGISEFAFTLAIVPNVWFSVSNGYQRLLDSELVKSKGINDQEERALYMGSRVRKSVDVCAIRSVSAIDNYLAHIFSKEAENHITLAIGNTQSTSNRFVGQPQVLSQRTQSMGEATIVNTNLMPILDVKYIDPGPVLSIDMVTMEALGIFRRSIKQNEVDPEYMPPPSLYELLNQCQSVQGKKQMRSIMMWPLQNEIELKNRYDTLDFFISPENRIIRDQLSVHLKNIVPLSGIMAKLSHSTGSYRELATVYKALWAFISMIDLIKENLANNLDIFSRFVSLDSPELRVASESMMNIIDFEASKRDKRLQVSIGVSQTVDEKKEIVENLGQFCNEVGIQETAEYRNSIGKPFTVTYIPRIGFLDCVEYSSISELLNIKTSKEFDVIFHTERSVYFKTKRMEELDANAGDVACDLMDVQETVVVDLQNQLVKHTDIILRLAELSGELDCLMSFAAISFQRNYTRPDLVSSDEQIDIKKAYHPLQSMKINIVPNDIHFYKDGAERGVKMMVITGPNACGKTTYMKAVCLVVYMAHIGCFVPALYAKLPIVDAILTRIHSANSISTGLSSFATDLNQINYAISRATENSIIVIDEFGKGTQTSDGFHLLKALVIYFTERARASPYVIISTHYSRLFHHLQSHSEFILYKTFKIGRDQCDGTIKYEFKLMNGIGDVSLADNVAVRAGLPQKIIERAKQMRDYVSAGQIIQPRPPRGA